MCISPQHHVARYCKKGTVESGQVMSAAFLPRPNEDGISVNWLEYFSNIQEDALAQVRLHIALNLDSDGRFAVLNVGDVRRLRLQVNHKPSRRDPSHTLIPGFSIQDQDVADDLYGLIIANGIAPAVIG